MNLRLFFMPILVLLCCLCPAEAKDRPATRNPPTDAAASITDEAQNIYGKYGDAVYQIQVVDLASDKKNSIGSGFQFSADGLIATNYHVVAEAVQRPDANRLEYLHDKGGKGSVTVLIADVVHDLAIVKMDRPGKTFVTLGSSRLPKGEKIFSLGNPHDIGFTIIEGTYNGYSAESFVDKIHFSGSLNPGMSGGPALAHNGTVVGVNVSTAGNQISFLVPVEPLKDLFAEWEKKPAAYDFRNSAAQEIEAQLLASQEKNLAALLKEKWESVPFGPLAVPGRVHAAFKCWGGAAHREKDPFLYYHSACSSQDSLFLDDDFGTGNYAFHYASISGKKPLWLSRFYSFYEGQYSGLAEDGHAANERDVTNFSCNDRFLDAAGHRWKASFCIRQYKKYPSLYDAQLYMALVGEGLKGLLVSLFAEGVSRPNALALTERFIKEIKPASGNKSPDDKNKDGAS